MQTSISRQVGTLIAVVLISGFNLFYFDVASADITIDGETVHVDTDGYAVQFDKGVITHIHNKHTGESYTLSPSAGRRGITGLLYSNQFWSRVNILTSRATLISATKIDPFHADLLFRQEDAEVRLLIALDPMTDELLIDMEGVSDTPGVVGMQWGVGYLDIQNLSVIVPIEGGRIIDATSPTDHEAHPYPGSGPGWEAQLAIVQGERGGFYVRNIDNTLQFKRFIYDRLDDGIALNFGTYNQAPFDSHTTGQSRMWRFNTYAGDWRVPASIYRNWMEQAFNPRRLSEAWTEDITLFVGSSSSSIWLADDLELLDRLAELVDPTKTLVMLKTWADGGEWWSEEHDEPFPDFFPKPELGRFVEHAHQHGFRVMPYIIVHGFSPNHPLYPHFQQYQYRDTWTEELMGEFWNTPPTHPAAHRLAYVSPASSEYRNLLVQGLKAVWKEYGVDGFFLDANHFVINDGNGLIDGLNMAQGMALLHKELAEAMPGIALGGERLHEATFARTSFAQRPRLTDRHRIKLHPISSYLFSPFTHAIGFAPKYPDDNPALHQEILNYSEVWGVMPTLNIWNADQLQEGFVETHNLLAMARDWQPGYGLNGDINNDGIVNILDLTLVAQNIGVMPLNYRQADVNGDGTVNVLDMILVSNMFEGTTIAR